MLENMRKIKLTQKINQERKQMEQNRPVKSMFKLERFENNATSAVAKTIKVGNIDSSPLVELFLLSASSYQFLVKDFTVF